MPPIEVVDQNYRIQPRDVQHQSQTLTISAISFQGLEQMQPLAHFVETRKRLLLTHDHCRTLILLTGSTLMHEWEGQPIRLAFDPYGTVPAIRILPPEDGGWGIQRRYAYRLITLRTSIRQLLTAAQTTTRTAWANRRRVAEILGQARPLLVILLLSVVSFFYARAYGSAILQWVSAIFSGNGG